MDKSNSQVLKMYEDKKQLDSDFTDLLDRITQLGQLTPSIIKIRGTIVTAQKYLANVHFILQKIS